MPVILCAMIAFACAVFVGVMTFLRREKIERNWRKRLIRKAKRHGRCAEAFMIQRETGKNKEQIITYEYEVGKNKFRKKIVFDPDMSYSNKITVYYNANSPSFGVCEEWKETHDGIGLSVFGWSFLTLIGVFFVLECTVGRHNGLWNDEMEMAYGEIAVLFSHPQLIVIGALIIALYILEFKWFSKRIDKSKAAWIRKRDEAIAAGRTALATQKSHSFSTRSHNKRIYHATYIYEINGTKYKYGHHFDSVPPYSLHVYYTDNPAKAFSDYGDHSVYFNLLGPVLFIFPIARIYFLFKLLGIDIDWIASL